MVKLLALGAILSNWANAPSATRGHKMCKIKAEGDWGLIVYLKNTQCVTQSVLLCLVCEDDKANGKQ